MFLSRLINIQPNICGSQTTLRVTMYMLHDHKCKLDNEFIDFNEYVKQWIYSDVFTL